MEPPVFEPKEIGDKSDKGNKENSPKKDICLDLLQTSYNSFYPDILFSSYLIVFTKFYWFQHVVRLINIHILEFCSSLSH